MKSHAGGKDHLQLSTLSKAMWANKNTAELHVFPRGSHGISWGAKLDKIPEVRIWPILADKFLRTVFKTR